MNPIDTDDGAMVLSAILDITERKADETALLDSEHRLRSLAAIVELSEDAIIGGDLDGVVTSGNRAAERVFGYGSGIVGQSISPFSVPARGDDMRDILGRIREASTSTITRPCAGIATARWCTSP